MKFFILLHIALIGLCGLAQASEILTTGVSVPAKHREFFQEYCVDCHNADKTKGKVRLDKGAFSFEINTVQSADKWQSILAALNADEMPPEDERQPNSKEKTEFLGMLSAKLVEARERLADSGGQTVMRRLNREEYENTLSKLLGVDMRAVRLPMDTMAGEFDTDGGTLFLSPDQIEQYIANARIAVRNSFEHLDNLSSHKSMTKRFEGEDLVLKGVSSTHKKLASRKAAYDAFKMDTSKDRDAKKYGFIDEANASLSQLLYDRRFPLYDSYIQNPLSKTGAIISYQRPVGALHIKLNDFWKGVKNTSKKSKKSKRSKKNKEPKLTTVYPTHTTGYYKIRAKVGMTPVAVEKGEPVFIDLCANRGPLNIATLGGFEITKSAAEGQIIEKEVFVDPDTSGFMFRPQGEGARRHFLYTEMRINKEFEAGLRIWVDWVEMEGPLKKTHPSPIQAIYRQLNKNSSKSEVIKLIKDFGFVAFRGQTPSTELLEKLYGIYKAELADTQLASDAIIETLATLLATPNFLYLSEPLGQMAKKQLSQRELAIRVAYLLTRTSPDEELLDYARRGELRGDQLIKQVDRLLVSKEGYRFYESFVSQWLDLQRLGFFEFDVKKFPTFTVNLKEAAAHEVYQTVKTIVDENLSTAQLLKSDFIVINSLLANHYGIKGVQGDHFRKVQLPKNSVRGGLSGMAATLAMGSDGLNTSPVERGAWILRKVLNDPPPPAPANVPELGRISDKQLTKSELLKAHQEEAQCAHCHKKIDPIGLGLENFDPTGKWRQEKTIKDFKYKIDPSGKIYRGPEFQNYQQLNDYFALKVDDFNLGLVKNLLSYSLGRKAGFTDQKLIEQLHTEMKKDGNNLRYLIHNIVASEAFQTKK